MPAFPSYSFDKTFVKARFLEATGSEAVNSRNYGLPRGVYLGFDPEATPGSLVLAFKPNARLGFSMFKVGAQSTKVQVDVIAPGEVQLDFTGHSTFPVYVIGRADYKAGSPTQGRVLTRATGPAGPQEITLCLVDKVGSDLVVSTTLPTHRQPPVAFAGQGVGYMYEGATTDLVFAQSATTEVIKSRDNLKTPPAPPAATLSARLALDLSGEAIADQLPLKTTVLAGNAREVIAGATSMNISDSFSQATRQVLPLLQINAGGTESTEGAITAPTDTDRNVVFLVEEGSNLRLGTATGGPVYGRLGYASAPITGFLTFTNALDSVVGFATSFTTDLQIGDLISAPGATLLDPPVYYAVKAIFNNTNLQLTTAYSGPTFVNYNSVYRRFTASFFSRTTGVEVPFALPVNKTIRPFFSAWFRFDRSIFDAVSFMKRVGEMPNLPAATDTVAGLVKLGASGGLAGAIYRVTNDQSLIGSNFHTLNFTAVNASVADAGGGVANITVPGNPGPPGPGSDQGPKGPTGPPAAGANAFNPFEVSGTYGPGGSGHTHNVTFAAATPPFAGDIVHVVGGFAYYEPFGFFSMRITGISMSGNVGTILLDLTGQAGVSQGRVFLGACV